ncbi:aminopeptidase NAALADL1-like [Rhipicephalus microplus]|uniref:aminopeptidase NAALADL1-like n=1 Tax=Rhipicephalus microplus TaxID=6941 RepID=UPI003F6DA48F
MQLTRDYLSSASGIPGLWPSASVTESRSAQSVSAKSQESTERLDGYPTKVLQVTLPSVLALMAIIFAVAATATAFAIFRIRHLEAGDGQAEAIVQDGGPDLPDSVLRSSHEPKKGRPTQEEEVITFWAPMIRHPHSSIDNILAMLEAKRISEHFRALTAETHLSGEVGSKHAEEYVAGALRRSGLHQVIEVPHRITHAYPDSSKPNTAQLLDPNGKVLHEAKFKENKKAGKMSVVAGYLAFSPNGTVKADMVFVNYGRRKDMDQLEDSDVEVKGRICLARFGGPHPVDKCRNCHERGGVGLLVFADPEDVAPLGPTKVYPDTAFVDGSALQRGSLYHYGDFETPGYPSVAKAIREEDTSNLSPIPALVIGYDDADVFLQSLGGKQLDWKGGLNNTYKTGPLFPEGRTIQMAVSSTRVTRVVKSVLGIIKGSGEPDRFVITGTHHDSWGYGAIEPSSATAALLELGRALGTLMKQGWAPRRTIVLASWAAGQMAFAGSSEWVEENIVLLDSGAIGYVSVDSCASGPRFAVHASPTLRDVVYMAAKQVPHGNIKLRSVWEKAEGKKKPRIPLIHGVGDHAAFTFYAGIPSIQFTFRPKEARPEGWFPAYHTAYDNRELFERSVDPQFALTLRCSQVNAALTLRLAEDVVLPYRVTEFADELRSAVHGINPSMVGEMSKHNISLNWLISEVNKFQKATRNFESWLNKQKKIDKATMSVINERLMLIERAFINREGLLGKINVRNMAFGADPEDAFAGKAFAFLHEHVYHAKRQQDAAQAARAWQQAHMDLSRLVLAVRMGNQLLDLTKPI